MEDDCLVLNIGQQLVRRWVVTRLCLLLFWFQKVLESNNGFQMCLVRGMFVASFWVALAFLFSKYYWSWRGLVSGYPKLFDPPASPAWPGLGQLFPWQPNLQVPEIKNLVWIWIFIPFSWPLSCFTPNVRLHS